MNSKYKYNIIQRSVMVGTQQSICQRLRHSWSLRDGPNGCLVVVPERPRGQVVVAPSHSELCRWQSTRYVCSWCTDCSWCNGYRWPEPYGGNLVFEYAGGSGQCINTVQLVPDFNSLVLFLVSTYSWHHVSEVCTLHSSCLYRNSPLQAIMRM